MKSIIRFSLVCIALICFSNMGVSQKKSKKKATSSVSSKKKKPTKKTSKQKKSNKKKSSKSKNKLPVKKVTTVAKYAPVKMDQLVAITDMPIKANQIDSTPEKVVTIVSAFKPQLKNIAKIGFVNATALVDTNTVELNYQVPSQNLSFQYQPIALVPRALKKDSLMPDRLSTFFKIGMGNYFNQLLQVQTSLIDQKDQLHQLGIKNESITGAHPIQKWNDIIVNYMGSMAINNKSTIHSQAYFNQSTRYRYGLVPDTTKLPLSNFEQKFTVIGANFSLVNQPLTSSKIHFAPILKFNHSNLLQQANDVTIDINSPIYFSFKNNIDLHTDLTFSLNQYNPLNKISSQQYFIQLDPSIVLKRPHLQLKMGVRPTYANSEFALYPKFELTKQLKDTNYVLQAGWKTTLTTNQLAQLMSQNHWIIAPNALPISSIESKYFQVAINVNKRLNYGFNMALNDYREIPFFNQTTGLNNTIQEGLKFDVLFEKRAIAIELKGDLRYQFSDKLLWKNQFKYIQFNLIRENKQAWGVLPFEFNSQFNWNYSKNLNFDASGQFWTGAKTSAGLGNAYQLNNTFVLNAGMQYAITSNWTFWAKGENLLDQQYQRWANYPSLGVQFIAGIQYKFSKK
jgi:hypothetical protein